MAGKNKMNTRERPSTDERRTAETYSVDLTSVCVKSGTINLPLKLLDRFDVGACTVVIASSEHALTVESPRKLVGLRDFFDEQQLRPNDSVVFAFVGDRIEVSARKRERSKAPTARAEAPTKDAKTVEGSSKTKRTELIRGTSAEAAGAGRANAGEVHQPRLELPPVKRVRIETDVPLNPGTVTPRPLDLASAREVWARREQPTWRSLTAPLAEAAETRPDDDPSHVTVRVIRRSQGLAVPLANEAHATIDAPAAAAPVRQPEQPTVIGADRRNGGSARAEPRRAPAPPRTQQAAPEVALDPYLDAPIDASSIEDAYHDVRNSVFGGRDVGAGLPEPQAARPTPGAGGSSPAAGATDPNREGRDVFEPVEVPAPAYTRFQRGSAVGRGPSRAPSAGAGEPGDAGRSRPDGGPVAALMSRFGLGRSQRGDEPAYGSPLGGGAPASGGASYERGVPERPVAGRSPALDASSTTWLQDEGASFEGSGWGGDDTSLSASVEPAPARSSNNGKGRVAGPANGSSGASLPHGAVAATPIVGVIIDESVYDVDFQTGGWGAAGAAQDGGDMLAADIDRLDELLSSASIPAIVRCEDLALRLALPHDRVVRAMERLSEDTERFTTLREGAYMIRRTA